MKSFFIKFFPLVLFVFSISFNSIAEKNAWSLPNSIKTIFINNCMGDGLIGFSNQQLRKVCECGANKIPEKYSSLKAYLSSVASGEQSLEEQAGIECFDELMNTAEHSVDWELPNSFKRAFNDNCKKGFAIDRELANALDLVDITATALCNCAANKIPNYYSSLKDFISADNQEEVGFEAGIECISELVTDVPNKKDQSENYNQPEWKLTGVLREEFYSGCIKAGIKDASALEIINALGFDKYDFCTCTTDKIPTKFSSLSDLVSSVGNDNDTRIKKVAEECMFDLMSGNSEKSRETQKGQSHFNRKQKKLNPIKVTGTGFFVSNDNVVTNHHVVESCQNISIRMGYEVFPVHIVAKNRKNDLAVLRLDTGADISSVQVAKLSGNRVKVGNDVMALGYPLESLLGRGLKVTKGNVSSLSGLEDDITQMQITAPVQSGNSGGPLINMNGNVVGVVTAKLDALEVEQMVDDLPQNVNFSIKSSVLESFLDAHDVEYSISYLNKTLTASDIVNNAKNYVVKVVCSQ